MISIVQRVSHASVRIGERTTGSIGVGLAVLCAVVRDDGPADVVKMAKKLAGLRVFSSPAGSYDLDVRAVSGAILLISNFTVAADTSGGRRPGLSRAMSPADAKPVFDSLVDAVRAEGVTVELGEFGADMAVTLTNDGPLTVIVDTRAS